MTARFDPKGSPAHVPGFLVGHANLEKTPSGVSVVLCPDGAVGGVSIMGSAAGTRQMDGLKPGHMVRQVHGLVFTGGSSFGLRAADGVQAHLEAMGVGLDVGTARIPIVPAAVIFDLALSQGNGRPDAELGLAACRAASSGPMARGSVGCGAGATIGKLFGIGQATKGGLGGASVTVGDLKAGAMVVVNAFGDVVDDCGRIIAGARTAPEGNDFAGTSQWFLAGNRREAFSQVSNTTLAVITTNAKLDKDQACKVAAMAHHGLVRTIDPVHTTFDGDLVCVLAGGDAPADVNGLGMIAARLLEMAVYDAVWSASGAGGLPSASDIESS